MENQNTMMTVMAVILAVIGSVIINGLANNLTTLNTVTNETLDLGTGTINGSTTNLAHFPVNNGVTLIASGKGIPSTPTNYTLTKSVGIITWDSSNVSGNLTATNRYWNASYDWEPSGYISSSSINGIILPYLSTFILLGVLALLAYMHFK